MLFSLLGHDRGALGDPLENNMTAEQTPEERVAALEAELADLKLLLQSQPVAEEWIQKITGIMSDDPQGFEAMVKYGREWRNADRPSDDDSDWII